MMTRWKASFIHLSLSAMIAIAVVTLTLLLWYTPPFFSAVGGRQILLILLGVDVSLGPLITLIIFNTKKSRKALTFDFSVIALLQITALIYGMNVMFQARPVFVVFSRDSFDLVTANMLSEADIAKAKHPEYRSLPLTGPVYVYTEMPTDIKERNELVFNAASGKDLPQFPQYYQPYVEHMSAAARAAKPIAELINLNPDRVAEIGNAVQATGLTKAELGFLPLRTNHEDIAVVVEISDGKVLTTLPVRPW
jgi:hypothetical protein